MLKAQGYWTENNFYQSEFEVDKPLLSSDSIAFFIPMWNCTYTGKIHNNRTTFGGFACEGEPFDSVKLVLSNNAANYLVNAKPGCNKPNYQYKWTAPNPTKDTPEPIRQISAKESKFIHSVVPEIINENYGRLNSFLVLKDNKLICEEYFWGYSRNDLHQIESSTKSITSLLIGIAKDKGMIDDINEPLHQIFPEVIHAQSTRFKEITLQNILTMTSGYECNDEALFSSENRIDFALNRKIINHPGSKFQYDGGNTEILGAVLKQKTGMFAEKFAEKNLFSPLGIEDFNWEVYKQNGFPLMSGALSLRPLDMLKIGMLVLNNGSFNNQQIISGEWIDESTSAKTETHIKGDDYSYQWWNINLKSNGKNYPTIWANGWGSQFIYIIPSINVVIVTTGYNYENDSWLITDGIKKYLFLLDE